MTTTMTHRTLTDCSQYHIITLYPANYDVLYAMYLYNAFIITSADAVAIQSIFRNILTEVRMDQVPHV